MKTLGGITTESVHKCTGKHWHQWLAILEKAHAQTWTHQEIVAFLKSKYRLGPWWQQHVTRGFEIAIGRRFEGQNAKGHYTVTATKSLRTDVKLVWKLLLSKEGQDVWLKPFSETAILAGTQFETKDGYFGEIRTIKLNRRLRMMWLDPNWDDKTTVQITLVARPENRSILVIDHSQIKTVKSQTELRARWKLVAADFLELLHKG